MRLNIFDEGGSRVALLRNVIGNYLQVDGEYTLAGTGFTKLDENPGAQSESEVYINEVTSSSTITKYETTFPFDSRFIPDNKAIKALHDVGRNHLTGEDAMFKFAVVDLYNPIAEGEDGKEYTAREFTVTAVVDSVSGGGGEKLQVSGNLEASGDPVMGKFNIETKTFTAGSFKGKYDTAAKG